MSNQVLPGSKYIEVAAVCVVGVCDLLTEDCCHPNFLKKFLRDTSEVETEMKKADLAMIWLEQKLIRLTKHSHVFGCVTIN